MKTRIAQPCAGVFSPALRRWKIFKLIVSRSASRAVQRRSREFTWLHIGRVRNSRHAKCILINRSTPRGRKGWWHGGRVRRITSREWRYLFHPLQSQSDTYCSAHALSSRTLSPCNRDLFVPVSTGAAADSRTLYSLYPRVGIYINHSREAVFQRSAGNNALIPFTVSAAIFPRWNVRGVKHIEEMLSAYHRGVFNSTRERLLESAARQPPFYFILVPSIPSLLERVICLTLFLTKVLKDTFGSF